MVSGHKRMTALVLFRNGYDTAQIATLKGIEEWEVYNDLHRQREAERAYLEARAYSRERISEIQEVAG